MLVVNLKDRSRIQWFSKCLAYSCSRVPKETALEWRSNTSRSPFFRPTWSQVLAFENSKVVSKGVSTMIDNIKYLTFGWTFFWAVGPCMLDTSSSYSDDLFDVVKKHLVGCTSLGNCDNILKPQSLLRVEGTAHAWVRWDSREIIAAVDFLPR